MVLSISMDTLTQLQSFSYALSSRLLLEGARLQRRVRAENYFSACLFWMQPSSLLLQL